MTTAARAGRATDLPILPIFATAFIGLAIIVFAGHLQPEALHAAAHDTRHATGFPCH